MLPYTAYPLFKQHPVYDLSIGQERGRERRERREKEGKGGKGGKGGKRKKKTTQEKKTHKHEFTAREILNNNLELSKCGIGSNSTNSV